MLLITTFVELCVVAGRSRTQGGSPQAVSQQLCCAMALRRTARSEQWHGHGMGESDTAVVCKSNGKTHSKTLAARHGRGTAWARHAMCESAFKHRLCIHMFITDIISQLQITASFVIVGFEYP